MLEPGMISPTPSMVETPDTTRTNPFSKTNPFSTPKNNTKRVLAPAMGASLTPSLEDEEEDAEEEKKISPKLTPKSKWQNAKQCKCCESPFGTIKRRHHCRRCGASCCQQCSRSRITVGKEDIRICQNCSNNMLVSEDELQQVREDYGKMKRELKEIKERFEREKLLNSKYSSDIENLNQVLSEQKRRASIQRREMTKMMEAVSTLKEKIENCEKSQDKMRDDHKQALKMQQDHFKEDFEKIKQIQNETSALLSSSNDNNLPPPLPPPLPRDPTRRNRRVENTKEQSDAACACVVS